MMQKLKNALKKLTFRHLFSLVHIKRTLKGFGKIYYSQKGEDIILSRIFSGQKSGFFVDVGAYHPKHYSNTYLLYKKGWSGINIDPNKKSIALFNAHRKRDINLNIGILESQKEGTYYVFNHQARNTFSQSQKEKMEHKSSVQYMDEIRVPCKTLKEVLTDHLPPKKQIDLLNIDVEGKDLEVLKSNDWEAFTPHIVVVEDYHFDIDYPHKSEIYQLLKGKRYGLVGITNSSFIFKHPSF